MHADADEGDGIGDAGAGEDTEEVVEGIGKDRKGVSVDRPRRAASAAKAADSPVSVYVWQNLNGKCSSFDAKKMEIPSGDSSGLTMKDKIDSNVSMSLNEDSI